MEAARRASQDNLRILFPEYFGDEATEAEGERIIISLHIQDTNTYLYRILEKKLMSIKIVGFLFVSLYLGENGLSTCFETGV